MGMNGANKVCFTLVIKSKARWEKCNLSYDFTTNLISNLEFGINLRCTVWDALKRYNWLAQSIFIVSSCSPYASMIWSLNFLAFTRFANRMSNSSYVRPLISGNRKKT